MASINEKVDPLKQTYGGILLGSEVFIKEKLKEMKGRIGERYLPSQRFKQLC